ncbi:MAG: response regulator [Anaerolineae bacterium]|nr:MAG: response regulator [Anaerolineae bacterium]MCL4876253.1 response regulator [Anaerolineae bacterium]
MLLKNKHIFIVEDDIANRAIIQMMLEREGAKTAIDRWGVDALPRIRAFAPVDLILLDLMFPAGISGFDIFDEIRRESDLAHIPIIAVSAMDPSLAIPKTQIKGFNGFIPKPIEYELFVHQIVSVLEGETVWFAGRGPEFDKG